MSTWKKCTQDHGKGGVNMKLNKIFLKFVMMSFIAANIVLISTSAIAITPVISVEDNGGGTSNYTYVKYEEREDKDNDKYYKLYIYKRKTYGIKYEGFLANESSNKYDENYYLEGELSASISMEETNTADLSGVLQYYTGSNITVKFTSRTVDTLTLKNGVQYKDFKCTSFMENPCGFPARPTFYNNWYYGVGVFGWYEEYKLSGSVCDYKKAHWYSLSRSITNCRNYTGVERDLAHIDFMPVSIDFVKYDYLWKKNVYESNDYVDGYSLYNSYSTRLKDMFHVIN
jgi:hypothetical protein